MPLYELVCGDCGHTKEQFLKLDELDENEPVCDKCGRKMKRAMSAPAFILKGSGWAIDSYGIHSGKKKGGGKKND